MNLANLWWISGQQKYGITRSRISFIMNTFRKPNFIDYDNDGGDVHNSLLNVAP